MNNKIFNIIIITTFWFALMGSDNIINMPLLSLTSIILSIAIYLYLGININWPYNKNIFTYIPWLLKEIALASISVSKLAWSHEKNFQPDMRFIKTKQNTELGKTLYGNSITLTPGTITVDISKNKIMVHALDKSMLQDLEGGEMDNKILKSLKC